MKSYNNFEIIIIWPPKNRLFVLKGGSPSKGVVCTITEDKGISSIAIIANHCYV